MLLSEPAGIVDIFKKENSRWMRTTYQPPGNGIKSCELSVIFIARIRIQQTTLGLLKRTILE
jgi:hypothetical protein